MPNPDEIAAIEVDGIIINDFLSVWVQIRETEAYPLFKFTMAERDKPPDVWTKLQFRPGQGCTISLAGQLAVTGVILERQVAYDANNHMVELSGVGKTYGPARSSVLHKTGNFDGKNFEEVAEEVLKPFGCKALPVGSISKTPFKELQCQPGENVWDFLERLARVRRVVMGSDEKGNFVLIGDHVSPVVQSLVEGLNILKMQCIISEKEKYMRYDVKGAKASHDDEHGRETKEPEASAPGTAKVPSVLITIAEQPVTQAELPERARSEAQWHEESVINATVTVQGWLRSAGALWKCRDKVFVESPMAMLHQDLKIATVTFTQDSASGTLTTLECVNGPLLNDRGLDPGPAPVAKSTYWQPAGAPLISSGT